MLVLPMTMAANTVEAVLAGRPASFSWRASRQRQAARAAGLAAIHSGQPVLDFSALQPGRAATDAISRIASELKLDADFQARVRQTGQIPMDDDEFGTITHNAGLTIDNFACCSCLSFFGLRCVRSGSFWRSW